MAATREGAFYHPRGPLANSQAKSATASGSLVGCANVPIYSAPVHDREINVRRLITASIIAPLAAFAWTSAALAFDPTPGDRVQGAADAPVTVIEYSSFTCSHCAAFQAETFPKIKAAYIDTGKVRWVNRDFPLDRLAFLGAIMVRCAPAERQDALADLIFKQQNNWVHAADQQKALAQMGRLAGMGGDKIDACWADKSAAEAVAQTRLAGENTFKVEATPTFILNDGASRLSGAESFDVFAKAFDALTPKN